MITEFISIVLILVGGIAMARCVGFDAWVLPVVGLVCGLSLLITISSLLVICGLPTSSFVSLGLTALLPIAWWASLRRRGRNVSIPIAPIAATAVTALLSVVVLHQLHLVKLSPDSFTYLNIGVLLASNNMEHAAPNWLQLRLLGVPIIHSPANLSGGYYLRSVTPLLSLSTLMLLGWICMQWCRSQFHNRQIAATFAVLAPLLLASHHQFAYHAFYINGHILVATCLLVLAGGSWLLASGAKIDARAIWMLQIICIPPLVVTRPEGALFAGLAILPTLVSERFCPLHRGSLLGTLGISVVAWHGFLWMRYAAAAQPIPVTVSGMLGLGIVSLILIPVLFCRAVAPYLRHLLHAVEGALWLAVVAFAARDWESFCESARATFHNVILDAGGWGVSLKLLCAVVVLTLLLTRDRQGVYLRFPVTTFIPLCFVLAFLRNLPYRVGSGDSLNRMFLHVVPLAILVIVSAAKADPLAFIGSALKNKLFMRHTVPSAVGEFGLRGYSQNDKDTIAHSCSNTLCR